MKTTFFLVAIVLALASCADSTVNPPAIVTKADTYFPLHLGDEWRYTEYSSNTFPDTLTVKVTGVVYFDNKKYFDLSNSWAHKKYLLPNYPIYYRTEGNKVYMYAEYKDQLLIDFDRTTPDSVNKNLRYVQEQGKTVTVPAGTFADCVGTLAYSSAYDAVPHENYAPNVGKIFWSGLSPTYKMFYANVDGKEYKQ